MNKLKPIFVFLLLVIALIISGSSIQYKKGVYFESMLPSCVSGFCNEIDCTNNNALVALPWNDCNLSSYSCKICMDMNAQGVLDDCALSVNVTYCYLNGERYYGDIY